MRTNFEAYLTGKGHSKKTVAGYLRRLGYFRAWAEKEGLETEEAVQRDLLAFAAYQDRRGGTKRTTAGYLNALAHWYDHLIDLGEVAENPARSIKLQGTKRKSVHIILPPEKLEGICQRFPEMDHNNPLAHQRDTVMLGLLARQGITAGELGMLETGHVKVRQGTIGIPGGRKSNGRELQLEAAQMFGLQEYLTVTRPELLGGKESGKLFLSNTGLERLHGTVYELVRVLKKGFPSFRDLHQLRASVIVKWLGRYNLRRVQYMAGHRYVSSTEKYRQSDLRGLHDDIDRYHPITETIMKDKNRSP